MNDARAPAELEAVAGVARRLAVLLAAGVTPVSAWAHLAAPDARGGAVPVPVPVPGRSASRSDALDPCDPVVAAARAAAEAQDVAAAIEREFESAPLVITAGARERAEAWGLFAAAWQTAHSSGAPLAAGLRRFADALGHAASLHRELAVAFSGPRSTARLVGALPLVGLLFGAGLGFDTLRVLFATPPGWACLVFGGALMLAAARWSGRMLARAAPRELAPGLGVELVAVAMGAGLPAERSRALAAGALDRYAPFLSAASRQADDRAVDAVLALATAAGVPTVGLLLAEAERRRIEADAAGRAAAASVAVRLMLPLAVCVLPAFMLLGVVPVLVALFSSTGVRFG